MQTETATSAWGYILLRCVKRRGNLLPTFVNLRKQILAVGSHRPHFCFPVGYIWETAISAWGDTTSLRGNDAATCLPSFVNLRKQILAEELRFTKVKSFRKSMQTETATSAWGYILLRCVKRRGNLLPTFVNLRKQILAVGSHRPHLYFPISYIWETATSAWGDTTSVRETTRQLHFYMIKDFSD